MKHFLPTCCEPAFQNVFLKICVFLVFCKMGKVHWTLSLLEQGFIGSATLNLHPDSYREPCKPVLSGVEVSARIAPWLAVMQRCEHIA
jgi:hypothetical protein